MFGKILRAGKGGHGCKYKIDVQITQLENLPTSIKKCRVVWARSAKVQMTDIKDVRGSVASFKQTLTQVTTIYRDKSGKYELKEYEFKVQVPGKSSSDSPVTIGKANLDMAKYCKEETTTQTTMLPIPFKVGGNTTGYLRMNLTTVFLGDSNEDGLTEVSGLTGLTSDHGSVREQDLEGFGDDEPSKFSKRSAKSSRRDDPSSSAAGTSGRSGKSDAARRHKPLPPTAEEDASDLEDEPAAAPASKAIRKKTPARQPEIEEPEEEDNPFTKKVSRPPSRRVPPKVWDDDEDVSPMNSDISDSEATKPPPKGKGSKAVAQESNESLDDMKASLFATKKPAAASGQGTAGQSAGAASAAASSSKLASSKSGRISAPPPPVEDEADEDALRNDLFAPKPKASAAGASSKQKAAAASGVASTAGAVAAAEFSGASSRHQKSKAAQRPPVQDEDDEDDEDDDYGPSTSAAPVAALKSRSKADSRATGAAAEAPVLKGPSSLTRAGSSKADAGKGVSTAEMEAMRQRISQLEEQLADERTAKDELNKKVHKYADKISDLEDQLAEGDVTELYAQMKEMEAKHQAEIKEMEAKYQMEIKELMERHLTEISELEEQHHAEVSELQEAASVSGRGRGGVSSDELKRLQTELAEQEGLLKSRTAKLEAEQAAANAARQAAEAKLAEANRAIDDSLLVATKHQQENKALQEEIAKLRRQLEDASMWETSAAVAAVTAASNNGRRSSEDEAELEELRERLEELQEENTRLQKLNEIAQGTAASILGDIRVVIQDAHNAGSQWSNTGSSSPLDQLAIEIRCLCDAYTHLSSESRKAQDRLVNTSARTSASGEAFLLDSAQPAKVKPHELLSRVQQLTAERDSLQDRLATQRQAQADLVAAQKLAEELRQQVDTLTFEKEAVERFKVATINDLRRQNDELRSSLKTLSSTAASPRTGGDDEDLLPAGTPRGSTEARAAFVGSASTRAVGVVEDEGNWNEFEELVAQLKADRAELRRQVEQLKADKAALGREVEDLRSGGGAFPLAAVAATASTTAAVSAGGTRTLADSRRADELEQQCGSLQAEVTRLQAQLAELSEADTIIKEWSDYADGLVADKTRLEQQVHDLTQRLGTGSLANDLRAADAERRIAEWQRKAADAERNAADLELQVAELEERSAQAASRAAELERQYQEAVDKMLEANRRADAAESRALQAENLVELAERRALDAESRASAADVTSAAFGASAAASPLMSARQQPADTAEVLELRRQIARLEESLSGLRLQLIETHSNPALSARTRHDNWDANASREAHLDAAGSRSDDEDLSDASGAAVGPDHVEGRGWHAELEDLRARNASLEATVAGLQASLEVATQQSGHGGHIRLSTRKAEQQLQELQSQLARVLVEKAELESTVVLLRAELERAPLVPHVAAAEDSAADGIDAACTKSAAAQRSGPQDVLAAPASPDTAEEYGSAQLQQHVEALEAEVAQLRADRSDMRAGVKELRLEVRRLEEEKNDAEATINRLSMEMEELAEALEASNSENERLSLEVLNLRDRLEQYEGGSDGSASRSLSEHSTKHVPVRVDAGDHGQLQGRSDQSSLERELAAVRAAARDVIRQAAMDSRGHDGFDDDPAFSGIGDDEDLVPALRKLQGHVAELQLQSRLHQQGPLSVTASNAAASTAVAAAAAAAEAQLAKATARIDELQQLLEDAEIENQHLTEQLEECLTGGRKGPDSVGSVAEECQSSFGGSVAAGATGASNPYSYGHANTLALSAFEQRLAMAEGQRDELSANLADAYAANKRLEADIATLQKELSAARRGLDPAGSGSLERSFTQVNTRGRGSRGASDSEDKKRLEELQSANRKLEAVCDDLEEKAHIAQEKADKLQAELEATKEKIRVLEAAAAAATAKRLEDELGGGGGGRQSKEKVTDLEARVSRLARENAALEEQLEDERATRAKLEETLKNKLDRAGDDEAAETVAAFEVKYNRLKERYKMLEESSQEELDELQDQLTEALSQITDLQRQIKQLQAQAAQGGSSRASAAANSANMEELRNLRSENERLVQQLVAKKLELAELSESEITMKRELSRLHEVNMKLAQKATTLEAQATMAQAGKAGRGKK